MNTIASPSLPRCCVAVVALLLGGCGEDPQALLEAMGRAYRSAPRYADDARVTVRQTRGDVSTDATYPFRVAFARPDRIRIEAYDARLVADGTTLYGAVGNVPGQVLVEQVQSPLAMDQVFADEVIRATLAEGEAGCPTQLPLLLADDTVDLILAEATGPPRIAGTETVDGHACAHVEITKPDGVLGLWIDRDSKLLRRMRVPTAAYAADLTRQAGTPVGIAVDVEFTAAAFDGELPADAFAFAIPAGAAEVDRLTPPAPPESVHPSVGSNAALPPLDAVDGTTITRESLGDSMLVIDFFFEGCGPAARSLPQVAAGVATFSADHARRHGGTAPALKHVAVSLDPDDVATASVRKKLAEFGGVGTLVRDPQGVSAQAFGLQSFPATVILTGDGRVADVIVGDHGRIAADVVETLTTISRGADPASLVRGRHARRINDYRRSLDRAATGATRLPEQVIAPRKPPVRFTLERLWRAAGVALPGNVVCLDASHGVTEPRVLALDGWRTVAELDHRGEERGRHELDLPADAGVGFLRTATGRDGNRWWAAGRKGAQQVFVFDDAWRLRTAYPETGGAVHDGISDAELADLDGDGVLELVVGYLGSVGVQAASLQGARLWRDRSSTPVVDIAVGPPRADGGRDVLAVGGDGRIGRVDGKDRGDIADESTTSADPVVSLVGGPVASDASWSLLAIASPRLGRQIATGIDPETLAASWTLPLGDGVHRDGPIDPLAWADLLGTPRRQWLIAAPDGCVTVAWADGRVVDGFCHGRPIVGIGGYRHDGRGHIVLATRDGLECFAVDDVALD